MGSGTATGPGTTPTAGPGAGAGAGAGSAQNTVQAITLIEAAREPGDLFGHGTDPARTYRRLARLTHPDACQGDARAESAFARLAVLWQRHCGMRGPLVARGDLANFYQLPGGLLKVARDPADSDLMDREAAALRQLRRDGDRRFGAYFPRLAGAQRITDPRTGAQRRANLIGALDGFVSLAGVQAAYPGGVDPRDAAWMWRRLLVAAGAAHRAGVIHGAVLPEHVMIHPAEHGLVLLDWCYSSSGLPAGRAGRGAPLPAIVARYRDWYPPEVVVRSPARQPAGPDTDIWLAARCMTGLMGDRMPAPLAAFARGCMLASPRRRPEDAWRLLAELDDLLARLYGPRAFRPFAIPA